MPPHFYNATRKSNLSEDAAKVLDPWQEACNGVQTVFHETPEGITVQQVHETAPILEANIDDYNSGHNGNVQGGWGRHVARIPNGVILDWMTRFGVNLYDKNHAPAVRRLLNSNEFRYLRTAPGQLAR